MNRIRTATLNTILLAAGLMLASVGVARSADASSLKLVRTIPLTGVEGKFDHLGLDAATNRLFIANKANNTLDIVDLKEGKLLKQIAGQKKISGIAVASDLGLVAIGNGEGVCNVFAGPDFTLTHSLKFPKADNVGYCPKTKLFYVEHAENKLSVFDGKTGEVKAAIDLPGQPEGFEIDSARGRLYICTQAPEQVAVIDMDKAEVIAKHPLTLAAKSATLAVDSKGQRIFVGCRTKPMIVVMDARTGKEMSSVEIPGDIDDLFFDAKRQRLYAICGEGSVGVVALKEKWEYELVEKVSTGKLARTGLFDAASDRLFVVVPRLSETEGPQLRVFKP